MDYSNPDLVFIFSVYVSFVLTRFVGLLICVFSESKHNEIDYVNQIAALVKRR